MQEAVMESTSWNRAAIERLNEEFDGIYVITLARNEARHQSIREGLAGLDIHLHWGVDGACLAQHEAASSYDEAQARSLYGRPLSPGELGCALSHVNVYRDALEKGHERILVIEDDVVLNHTNLTQVPGIFAELPEKWDLLYLCTYRAAETAWLRFKVQRVYPLLNATGIRRYPLQKIQRLYSRAFSRHLRRAGMHNGTWAYALTRAAATRLIKMQTPVVTISDHALMLLCQMEDVDCFLASDNVFEHRDDLGSAIWDSDETRLEWVARAAGPVDRTYHPHRE
jgi:glycosyl transferase, family 25